MQFIDSVRFMVSLWSNFDKLSNCQIDNLPEGIHKNKSKNEYDNKKNVKRVELNTNVVSAFLNT